MKPALYLHFLKNYNERLRQFEQRLAPYRKLLERGLRGHARAIANEEAEHRKLNELLAPFSDHGAAIDSQKVPQRPGPKPGRKFDQQAVYLEALSIIEREPTLTNEAIAERLRENHGNYSIETYRKTISSARHHHASSITQKTTDRR